MPRSTPQARHAPCGRFAIRLAIMLLATTAALAHAADRPPTGFQATVPISAEGSLDWVFVLSNQSKSPTPAELTKGYDAREQRYQLYVPEKYDAKRSYPVILFISASGNPAGWGSFEPVCRKHEVIFASPYEAGNSTASTRRVRTVLDVLDDIRRRYQIDADRVYIGGFSGGARVASMIAFALPEQFGGTLPVCAAGDFREEVWLRQRVVERLSIAHLTGENDFNRGEVERLRTPFLTELGARAKHWTVPKMGHSIPSGSVCEEAWQWLEEDLPRRRELAQKRPASRWNTTRDYDRDAHIAGLRAEADERIKTPATRYSGLMLLKGISVRWADTEAGKQATQRLAAIEAQPDKSWEQEDIADQRSLIIARARAVDAYASGELPSQYAGMRSQMLTAAIRLWSVVLKDGQNKKAVAEAEVRIPALEKQLAGE